MIPAYFQIEFSPLARPEAVVSGPNVRFTVLTSRLIRMEYSPTGIFEDRPSQVFWYRRQPVPEFRVEKQKKRITIDTGDLLLNYTVTRRGFAPDTLSVVQKMSGVVWHYDDPASANLGGTARTLDNISGYTPLEPGLLSRAGWSVVDDSHTLVFNAQCWLEPRNPPRGALDLYFFGYGHAYQDCLRDYCRVAGKVPVLPRWALGNWWSRFWKYSESELLGLMDEFKAYNVPLSVCIVDMDWHLRETAKTSTGWTGYTWNPDYFPNPQRFIDALHARGLKTALNLHPAEGVHPHESMYAEMAERTGIDPATETPVPFDIATPDFTGSYFEVLHHPQEANGINFWWIDWQQGEISGMPGLDPLWWLNHLHFYDLGRDGSRRSFIFSRWGGLGNHRYPIGFSGDTQITWETLAFQPYFTATAANVGYGWWSHDIGGHFGGIEEPELYARWVQFGTFSPILRLHSTDNRFLERRPWGFGSADVLHAARDAMQLRHALIPYLYTMSWINATDDIPPFRPMYHDYPDQDEAYACPQQYLFGSELIAAPFTSPADPDTRMARQVVWLPEGDWYDFFSGEHYTGGGWHAIYGRLQDIPVFAKAGAIVPLGPKVGWGGVDNPAELDIHIFAGADGQFTLFEDDGESRAFERGEYSLTGFRQEWSGDRMTFTMTAAAGDPRHIPTPRAIRLHVHGIQDPELVSMQIGGDEYACTVTYDAAAETLYIQAVQVPVTADLRLYLTNPQTGLLSHRDRLPEKLTGMLHTFRISSGAKQSLANALGDVLANPARLADFALGLADSQVRALFELICQAGMVRISNTYTAELIVLWNNRQDPRLKYQIRSTAADWRFFYRGDIANDRGVLPRFKTFEPPLELSRHGYLNEQVSRETWQVQVSYFDLFSVTDGVRY